MSHNLIVYVIAQMHNVIDAVCLPDNILAAMSFSFPYLRCQCVLSNYHLNNKNIAYSIFLEDITTVCCGVTKGFPLKIKLVCVLRHYSETLQQPPTKWKGQIYGC